MGEEKTLRMEVIVIMLKHARVLILLSLIFFVTDQRVCTG